MARIRRSFELGQAAVSSVLDELKHKILQVVIMALIIGFFKRALSIPIEGQQDLQSMAIAILLIAVSSYLVHLQSNAVHSQDLRVSSVQRRREKYRQQSPNSAAALIANADQQTVSRHIEEDPTDARRIAKLDSFKSPQDRTSVTNRFSDDALSKIRGNAGAIAVFGLLKPFIAPHLDNAQHAEDITATAAKAILNLIQQRTIRDWNNNNNVLQDIQSAIDDYLYDVICDKSKIDLTPDEMDEILEKSLQLVRTRPKLFQARVSMGEKTSSQKVSNREIATK